MYSVLLCRSHSTDGAAPTRRLASKRCAPAVRNTGAVGGLLIMIFSPGFLAPLRKSFGYARNECPKGRETCPLCARLGAFSTSVLHPLAWVQAGNRGNSCSFNTPPSPPSHITHLAPPLIHQAPRRDPAIASANLVSFSLFLIELLLVRYKPRRKVATRPETASHQESDSCETALARFHFWEGFRC